MKTSALTRSTVGIAVAALLIGMAATAQDSFDKAPIPPPAQPLSQPAPVTAKPACPKERADRWGGCRGKDYNGPIGDWGDPEYDDRHRRIGRYAAGDTSGHPFAVPSP